MNTNSSNQFYSSWSQSFGAANPNSVASVAPVGDLFPHVDLAVHSILFTAEVQTPIHFGDFKGSALRGAFANVLRRTFCPEWRAEQTDPFHRSLCPICQLLTVENEAETAGDIRRPYAVQPPLGSQNHFAAGDRFQFGMTLFGNNLHYLPYLILAAGGVGKMGVGKGASGGWRGAGGGSAGGEESAIPNRGTFEVVRIDAVHPLSGEMLPMMEEGDRLVHPETLPVTHEQIMQHAALLLKALARNGNLLTVEFLTPTRLTQEEHLVKSAEFLPLAKHVVLRLLDLAAQHGGGRPSVVLKSDLYPAAEQVMLVQDHTHWWDVKGYSGRTQRQQVLGGLVGRATYWAPDWQPLLPWLLWGSITQVGKNVVKGCGIYRVV